jgi:sec-independent protein translocase protein TatA
MMRLAPGGGAHVLGKLGMPELLIIGFIAVLIFGTGKIADLGKGLGEGIKNFKSAMKDGEAPADEKKPNPPV